MCVCMCRIAFQAYQPTTHSAQFVFVLFLSFFFLLLSVIIRLCPKHLALNKVCSTTTANLNAQQSGAALQRI